MWYQTEEEALEGCKDKKEIYGYEFEPLKEYIRGTQLVDIIKQDYIYWAKRKLF